MNHINSGPLPPRHAICVPSYVNTIRNYKDYLAKMLIGLGGTSVIIAVCLIFVYLLFEVMPLFRSAEINAGPRFPLGEQVQELRPRQALIDELGEVLFVLHDSGYYFQSLQDGRLLEEKQLTSRILHNNNVSPELFGVLDGTHLRIKKVAFNVMYDQDLKRQVVPVVLDAVEEALILESQLLEPDRAVFHNTEEAFALVMLTQNQEVFLKVWQKEESLFGQTGDLNPMPLLMLPKPAYAVQNMMLSPDLRWLYLVQAHGLIEVFDLSQASVQEPSHIIRMEDGVYITQSTFLLGGFSFLVGDSSGQINQWMPVRDEANQYRFERIRTFQLSNQPIQTLIIEHRRKGFVALDDSGALGIYNATAYRSVLKESVQMQQVSLAAINPRADKMVLLNQDALQIFDVHNEHPEVSWKSLWQKIWYEGYDQPEYIWQSSAANNDFEPKFSLMPLSFGTLKAAFYAMLLAMPLAICGAIYTAYFMSPVLRKKVKPSIELMEALPTVILGFLAGLWLAPFVEQKLPGMILLLLITPWLFLMSAFLFSQLPAKLRFLFLPQGWEALSLLPVLGLSIWLSLELSDPIQSWFFQGDIRVWLNENGIGFDQRNALVVGFAMGFAVIPTIFSIAEDAVFAVPKHLTYGSLALGASPWQTLMRVVLPTASPGIFSAVMIGFGRAVGETMIVLMATGNTPIMDINIFEGFRTLSANIAVEMPEAEVNSTHFRILFLAALVLFAFTFVLNTSAEFIRQRLREKYSSL